MISEQIKIKTDDYLDKFIDSELSMIKIDDDEYSQSDIKRSLQTRISERNLHNLTVYSFMNGLYLEKK